MENFEYEYHEEPKKGGGGKIALFIIVLILIIGAFVGGVFSRDYINILPDRSTKMEETDKAAEDATPDPTATPDTQATAEPTPTTETNIAVPYSSIPDIVDQVTDGVVSITSYFPSDSINIDEWEPVSYGTGVIISSDGYIVTNNHVIANAGEITVTLANGEKVSAEIIGKDRYVDLAVIKIEKEGLYTIPFGDSSKIRVGEQVIAIGSPLGDELTGTVTSGIISAVDRELLVDGIPFTLLQTDAAINPGNSGGPLVNMQGELIGINTLKSVFAGYNEFGSAIAAEGISYSIPSNSVEKSIADILEFGEIVRPFIGVSGGDAANIQVLEYDLPDGFYIAETVEGGPAATAGVLAGDVIIKIEDTDIKGFTDLYTVLNSHKIGDTLKIVVYRPETDEELELEVTLASNQDFND
ncbi:MAG: trypsin-like peptidase domain-containing protein [Eubacteriales bacterium]